MLLILWFAMLCALVIYFFAMQVAARDAAHSGGERLLGTIFLALAGALAGVTLCLRAGRIAGLLSRSVPLSEAELGRLRAYYIVCFALAEAVGLYGFVLYFVGSTLPEVLPFFGAAFLLLVICFPRVPA